MGNIEPENLGERLRANEVPTPRQRAEVLTILEDAENEMFWCDLTIARLKAHVVALQKRKDVLSTHMEQSRSLLAPIRTLPDEILNIIFQIDVQIAGGSTLYANGNDHSIRPNILGAVCIHWRRVTLSNPALWVILDVTLADVRRTSSLDLILDRSCTQESPLPLEITIAADDTMTVTEENPILRTMLSHCNRWCKATLKIPHHLLNFPIFSVVYGNIGRLEFLSLMWDYRTQRIGYPVVPGVWSMFETAPRLKTIEVLAPGSRYALPWMQATTVRCLVQWGTPADIREDLEFCRHAQTLYLHISMALPSGEDPDSPLVLDCDTLELDLFELAYNNDPASFSVFLQARVFTCPNLHSLEVANFIPHSTDDDCAFPLDPLIDFCIPLGGSLRSLSIHDTVFTTDMTVVPILTELPLLETLTVEEFSLYHNPPERRYLLHQSVLEDLKASRTDPENQSKLPTIIPRLKTLIFGVVAPSQHFSIPAFIRLLESRWLPDGELDGVVSLENVTLRWGGGEAVVNELKPLKLAGQNITVHSSLSRHVLL